MKQSGTTIIFVIVCIGVLIAAYVVGICIRGIRFGGVENESKAVAVSEKAVTESKAQGVKAMPAPETSGPPRGFFPGQKPGSEQDRAAMKERFENMTEEEKQQARAATREKFSGRRREGGPQVGGPQLSDEDRTKMMEEIEGLRERWEEMSEEEREEARAQMLEKYGFVPRVGQDVNRGPVGGEGGRRRPGSRPGGR